MNYKLVLSDVDGTLFKKDLTVGDRTKRAIKAFTNRGGAFVLCSGRAPVALERIAKVIGTDGQRLPFCAFNGALIKDRSEKVIADETISNEDLLFVVRFAKAHGERVVFYNDKLIVDRLDDDARRLINVTFDVAEEVGDFEHYLAYNTVNCKKAVIVGESENISKLIDKAKKRFPDTLEITSGAGIFLEAQSKRASKGTALIKTAEYLGVPIDKTLAVGDYLNDIPMLEAAGLGVAVANAHDDVKAVADYVSKNTNEEDAVAEILEKFCFD